MKFLGIDYGEKNIGIAISDESAKFAFPYSVVDNISAAKVLGQIKKICDKNNVGKMILGQSLTYKMKPNAIMKRIEKFKSLSEEKLKIPVEYENEVLTTKQAERSVEKKPRRSRLAATLRGRVHASAAALILQTYLDKQR